MLMAGPAMTPPAVAGPDIVVTLRFPGIENNKDAPPTYEVAITGSSAKADDKGNIDFRFKENNDARITFKIHPDYQQYVEFAPLDDKTITYNAMRARDSNDPKIPPTAKHFSDQFYCPTGCDTNYNRDYIVVGYDNAFFKGPYTRYGFRYAVKNVTPIYYKETPDPGIKNGGLSLSGSLAAALAVVGALAGIGLYVVGRFIRRRLIDLLGRS